MGWFSRRGELPRRTAEELQKKKGASRLFGFTSKERGEAISNTPTTVRENERSSFDKNLEGGEASGRHKREAVNNREGSSN